MKYFVLFPVFLLISCGAAGNYKDYLRMHNIPPPTPENFIHCHSYGCQTPVQVALPNTTKDKVKKLFTPAVKNAQAEREKIAQAIKIFETDIGALTGTDNDKRGTFRLYEEEIEGLQQDCIDESTNTTIYLGLMDEIGFLKFHKPIFPANRQPFLGGAPWWHQTAVIQDIETHEKFAVDSWFRDNGHAAFIVPLQEWKEGWMAPKLSQNHKIMAKNQYSA